MSTFFYVFKFFKFKVYNCSKNVSFDIVYIIRKRADSLAKFECDSNDLANISVVWINIKQKNAMWQNASAPLHPSVIPLSFCCSFEECSRENRTTGLTSTTIGNQNACPLAIRFRWEIRVSASSLVPNDNSIKGKQKRRQKRRKKASKNIDDEQFSNDIWRFCIASREIFMRRFGVTFRVSYRDVSWIKWKKTNNYL